MSNQDRISTGSLKLVSSIQPVKAPTETIILLFFLLVSISFITIFSFATYSKKVPVTGIVRSIEANTKYHAKRQSLLVNYYVKAGDRVTIGDPLYRVKNEISSTSKNGKSSHENQLTAKKAEQQIRHSRILMLENRLTILESSYLEENSIFEDQLSLEKSKIESVRQTYDVQTKSHEIVSSLFRRGLKTKNEHLKSEEALLQHKSALYETEIQLINMKRSYTENREDYQRQRFTLMDNIALEKIALKELESQIEKILENIYTIVKAGSNGIVDQLFLSNSAILEKGQLILSVRPEDAKYIGQLHIPSNAIGHVEPGMKIYVEFTSYPYDKYGLHISTIERISQTTFRMKELNLPEESEENYYLAEFAIPKQVELSGFGSTQRVVDGMLIRTHVILKKQTLLEWLLGPINKSIIRNPDFFNAWGSKDNPA